MPQQLLTFVILWLLLLNPVSSSGQRRLRSSADTSDNWNHYVIRIDAVPALREALR
jgi:hypothetical protein